MQEVARSIPMPDDRHDGGGLPTKRQVLNWRLRVERREEPYRQNAADRVLVVVAFLSSIDHVLNEVQRQNRRDGPPHVDRQLISDEHRGSPTRPGR